MLDHLLSTISRPRLEEGYFLILITSGIPQTQVFLILTLMPPTLPPHRKARSHVYVETLRDALLLDLQQQSTPPLPYNQRFKRWCIP